MKLYYASGACSLAPHIALRELGLSFETESVDLKTHTTASGMDFYAINPLGSVPVLVLDNGRSLTGTALILQYLADRAATTQATSDKDDARLKTNEWLVFIATELHKTFSPWLWRPDFPNDVKPLIHGVLEKRFAYLDEELADRDFLLGTEFSVADAYAFAIVNWTNFLDIDIGSWKNLKAYMARVAARPKVHEALVAEGLS